MSRSANRSKFDVETRVALLENDADEIAADVAKIAGLVQRLTWGLAGATITLATTSILLAVNLILHA